MSEKGIELLTPVARLVWGHPLKPQLKKYQDGANKGQTVMKDGQPVQQWSFGLAIPRAEFEAHVWPLLSQEAMTGYANIPPRFSWKFKDGDAAIDPQGKKYSEREGYAGHYVLTISTELQAPAIFKLENGQYRQLEAHELKTGDYIRAKLNVKVNVATGTNTPSLYVNPLVLELIGYGAEIVGQSAPDPMAAFGGVAAALPAGATAIPSAAAGAPLPPMPGGAPMPGPGPAPMAAPPPPAPAAPPPPAGPTRPTDPAHIHAAGTPQEQWWINGAWTPAVAPAAPLPPPAPDFVNAATGAPPAGMPGMIPPR